MAEPICPRCRCSLRISTMSRFNTQTICLDCESLERTHPAYAEAHRREEQAVLRGDYNFPGVGLPPDYAEWAEHAAAARGATTSI